MTLTSYFNAILIEFYQYFTDNNNNNDNNNDNNNNNNNNSNIMENASLSQI